MPLRPPASALLSSCLLALPAFAASARDDADVYALSPLQGPRPGHDVTVFRGRSARHGVMVGDASPIGPSGSQALLFRGTKVRRLDSGGMDSLGLGVNSRGDAFGTISRTAGDTWPVRWRADGTVETLAPLATGDILRPLAIADTGGIVGQAIHDGQGSAVAWRATIAQRLPLPAGFQDWPVSTATAASPSGRYVAGELQAGLFTSGTHLVRWDAGRPQVLQADDGSPLGAAGVNDAGQVVGTLYGAAPWRAYVTQDDRLVVLPPLIPGTEADAYAINRDGVVAGMSDCRCAWQWTATIWRHGQVLDLTAHLDATARSAGWVATWAYDIDEDGVVFAAAQGPAGWAYVLLTPVAATP